MRTFLLRAVSAVYVFDASMSPFLHFPLPVLTLIYLCSVGEIIGMSKVVSYIRRWRAK